MLPVLSENLVDRYILRVWLGFSIANHSIFPQDQKTRCVGCRTRQIVTVSRREFIAALTWQVAGLGLVTLRLAQAAEASHPEMLPRTRQITFGPRFHWFGYYDKLQFSADNRFVLGNEVDFEERSPTAEDRIRVGIVDLQTVIAGTNSVRRVRGTGSRVACCNGCPAATAK